MQRLFVSMFAAGVIVLNASGVASQDYPNRPIRIIAAGPSGSSDFIARFIAQGISAPLGQPVIVENRPSSLTAEIASKGCTWRVASGNPEVIHCELPVFCQPRAC